MQRIAQFEKVSLEQFLSTCPEGKEAYEKLKLPQRATSGSAGYDFYMPYDLTLAPGQTALIPTGIRARMQDGWVLCLFPRSGLGFKFRMQLNNTVGIIDADYYHSDNEGHIQAKITNDSRENKVLELKQGQGFMQGIFLPFGITEDDEVNTIRNGGFGSTTK
ncbi:Deoxyuridine 5'-triphosphate nucleotidohydrolase [Clostridiales bacterium CHKCI006]|nr:Deoxyuridine 5'-triphosphate nucleotidohydrolase [Clostridiales bacterium CHKCI006]